MITDIEDFFDKGCGRCARFATADCSVRPWAAGLRDLRRMCLAEGLVETVKWGHPCYTSENRNIVIIGAFRADFRLTFFNAALMKDPSALLEKQGPNTRHPDMIRFTDNAQPSEMESLIRPYIQEAIHYARSGLKPPSEPVEMEMPEELTDALDCDPELAEAFTRLTPGRQRSYLIHLNGAKTPQTRIARILKFRPHILAGKGATER